MLNIQFKMFCYSDELLNCGAGTRSIIKGDLFGFFLSMYTASFAAHKIPQCRRMLKIEPRTVPTLALTARRSNHSARSHQHLARSPPLCGAGG